MTHFSTPRAAARAALLAATALLLTCATPAQATAGRAPAHDWLLLTVTHGETPSTHGETPSGARPGAPSGSGPGTTRGALLLCDPPRGHARAAGACAELGATGGRIADIPPRDTHCTLVHAPVTAHAHGQWRGRPVRYTQTFPNPCVMTARTGSVFAWDTEGEPR
ncbi:SSI family serine proteinase inhibitor [Streptomyces sp. BK79]|uniref:SSI family serine proteinase inhibitor n=1 Tax=Streptomyces sp. BK79 TaxID=3350097 RepID=UPI00377043A0